jgi:hypothetical protein
LTECHIRTIIIVIHKAPNGLRGDEDVSNQE